MDRGGWRAKSVGWTQNLASNNKHTPCWFRFLESPDTALQPLSPLALHNRPAMQMQCRRARVVAPRPAHR